MGKLSGVLLVAAIVASACTSSSSVESTTTTPAPTTVIVATTASPTTEPVSTTTAPTTTSRVTTTTRAATATTQPELPTITSGVYIVPDEVPPGTYRFVGYMARLDADQDIIDNDLVNGDNGVGIMIVADTDTYSDINGEAILVDDTGPIDPIALGFTEGTYLVGYDIQPGRYRITPPADRDTAYWARLDKTMGIIDNDLGSGQLIVVVKASDWALQYTGTITELP